MPALGSCVTVTRGIMLKLPSEMIGDQSGESNGWRKWWIFAIASWVMLFVCGFIALFRAWKTSGQGNVAGIDEELIIFAIPIACVVISSFFVGLYALINKEIRSQLLSLPTAAALSCLALSFIIAMLCLVGYSIIDLGYQQFIHGSLSNEGMTLEAMMAGLSVGVIAFPLTFGLAFPLGMPLGGAIFLYITIKARGSITFMSWIATLAFSIFGWWLVVIVGLALGLGG